jgi:carotenoid cleavage dioxygenase-like enzyme
MPVSSCRASITQGAREGLTVHVGDGNHRPGNFLDNVIKLDVTTGAVQEWWEDVSYPGEPVFVARPGSDNEDEGVLLSVVLDAGRNQSFLLVLDVASLGKSLAPNAHTTSHSDFMATTSLALADIHT